ncbi:unnamed protein product, partial [Closterium sp. NIES-53]
MVAKASSSNNLIRCPVVLQVAIFVTLLSLYYKLFSDPFPQSWPLLGPSDAVTIKTSVVTTSMVTTQMVTASTPAASPGAVPDASLGSNNNSSFPNPVAVRDTSSSTAIPSISTAAPSSSSIPDSSICSQAVLQDSKTTTTTSTPQVLVVSPEDFISTIDTNPKDSPQSHAKPDPIPPTAADLPVSPLPSLLTIPGSRFTSANQLLSFQTRLACLSANATWQLDPTPRTLPWSHAVSAGWECDDRWRSGPGQNNSRYKNVAFKEADDIALAGGSAEEWKVRNTVKYKWVPEGRCGEWGDVDKGKLAEKLEGLTVFIVGDSINAMLFKSLRNHFRQASTPGSVQQGEQQNSRKAEGESLELVEFTPAFCKSRTKNRLLQQRPYLLLCTGVTLGNTKFIYVRDDVMSTDLHLYVKFPKRISVPWLDVIVKGEAVRERQRKDQEKRREEEKKRRQQERRMQQLEGWQEQKEQLQMKWLEQQKRRKVQERHGKQVQEERHDERQGGKGEEEEKRIGQWRLFGWPFSETPQASANKVPDLENEIEIGGLSEQHRSSSNKSTESDSSDTGGSGSSGTSSSTKTSSSGSSKSSSSIGGGGSKKVIPSKTWDAHGQSMVTTSACYTITIDNLSYSIPTPASSSLDYIIQSLSKLVPFIPATTKTATADFADAAPSAALQPPTGTAAAALHSPAAGTDAPHAPDAAPHAPADFLPLLVGVSAVARPGQVLAVAGPSGAGKSTLLDCIGGRIQGGRLRGSILVNGQRMSTDELRRISGELLSLGTAGRLTISGGGRLRGSILVNGQRMSTGELRRISDGHLPWVLSLGGYSVCGGGRLRGSILVNGQLMSAGELRRISGYVQQDDALFPHLTPRESLLFSAHLRLPSSLPLADKLARVDALLATLGLQAVAHTRIGSTSAGSSRGRGLSGGERRRVSIGMDLVHNPAVVLLDEPTSGLDSAAAANVLGVLRGMAKEGGRTVLLSIHQPSFRMLELIDSLLLLSRGSVVHCGPLSLLEARLAAAGCTVPMRVNALEYAMEGMGSNGSVLWKRLQQQQQMTADEQMYFHGETAGATAAGLVAASHKDGNEVFHELPLSSSPATFSSPSSSSPLSSSSPSSSPPPPPSPFQDVPISIQGTCAGSSTCSGSGSDSDSNSSSSSSSSEGESNHGGSEASSLLPQYATSPLHEIWWLSCRNFKNMARTPELCLGRASQVAFTALCLGTLFLRLPSNAQGIEERMGFFAFSLAFLLTSSVEALPVFLEERQIFLRETSRGAYRISSYAIASVAVFLPFLLLLALLYSIPAYLLVGLHASLSAFFFFLLVVWAVLIVANAIVACIAAMAPDFITANSMIAGLMGAFFLFSGYFIAKKYIPSYWIWMHYLSVFKYPLDALIINEYGSHSDTTFGLAGTGAQ